MSQVNAILAAVVITTLCAGCGASPVAPSPGVIVTFAVVDERFRVSLTGDDQVAAARAAQAGGPARIPTGRIVAGPQANTGWSWHLEDVTFAESTIELCDGRPSDVERQGTRFGGGRYCPWGATIVDLNPLRVSQLREVFGLGLGDPTQPIRSSDRPLLARLM